MRDTLNMLNIRPFELATDLGAAFGLWRDTLNMTWPLDETCFRRILLGSTTGQSGVHLVAERDGQFAGWLASDVAPNRHPDNRWATSPRS